MTGPKARSTVLERMKSEPGLFRNAVVTVALVALAVVVGGLILSNQRFIAPWDSRQVFYATFPATPGISPGNGQEVRVRGVIVGDIIGADVADDGRARVKLSVKSEYPVFRNASLVLRPKSPLNEMYITMDPGGPPAPRVAEGETLPVGNSVRPIQIDEVLGHLDDQAQQALTSLLAESDVALVSAQRNLPPGLEATRMVANDLRPVAEQLATRKELLRRLVTALAQVSHAVGGDDQRVRALAASLQTTLRSLGGHSDQVDASLAELPGVVDQLGRATREVRSLTDELDPTLHNLKDASEELPEALESLRGTAGRLDEVVDAAGPFVDAARPVIADLRPVAGELRTAVPELEEATRRLDPVTAAVLPYLPDLGAFAVQTRSIVSVEDANSGTLRGALDPSTQVIPPVLGPNNGVKPVPAPPLLNDVTGTGRPDTGSAPHQPDQPGQLPGGGTDNQPERHAPGGAPDRSVPLLPSLPRTG